MRFLLLAFVRRVERILNLPIGSPFSITSLGELRSCAWTKNTGPLMSEITPETLLAAGALILLLIAVWWGGKAVKGWFWTCYAVLMMLALAYALWHWLG